MKVLDFGISKAIDPQTSIEQQQLTSTSAVMGSPLYMSPEQVRSSKTVDARSDVWALGVVLYELLTNKHPFEAETMTALLASIIADAPIPLRQRRAEVPPAIEQLVMGCLEKDPARRVASVAHFAQALAPFAPARAQLSVERVSSMLGNVLASSRPSLPGVVPAAAPPTSTQAHTGDPSWGNTLQPRKRSALPIGIAAAVLVLGGGGAAVAIAMGGHGTPPAPPAAAVAAPPEATTTQATVVLEPAAPKATASETATKEPTPPTASETATTASTASTAGAKVTATAHPTMTIGKAPIPPAVATKTSTTAAPQPTKARDVLDTR